ncbi:MAG: hypothetical protein CVU87_02220 [Firmicutes bacterium HGW-Firmicutes-12]|jgi:PAS domain S-box-containing protein|nr:MAG: hypothetical protein CVU87_02220 [Firmicutes bacterium HGW-Firmicutes-12]
MIISTDKEKCRQCYACVRNCPVKAVRIENGQAEVIESRCIECGNCLTVCALNAKKVMDNQYDVKRLLQGPDPVSVILAPSFVASFNIGNPMQIVSAIKALGFYDVWTAALGAQFLIPAYQDLLKSDQMVISTPCPAVVNMVEKHFPTLLPVLAPLVSPMVATAIYLNNIAPNRKLVFVGPCIAKKGEAQLYGNLIQYVLTFTELKNLMNEHMIDIKACKPEKFAGPMPFDGQLIPLSGGLSKMLKNSQDFLETEFLVVDGQAECYQMLQAIEKGEIQSKLIDILMCRGCIDGPAQLSNEHYFNRKKKVVNYFASIPLQERCQGKTTLSKIAELNFHREYIKRQFYRLQPEEKEIQKILASTGKLSESDLTNCGACGYSSCREKAIAVYEGIAEIEMCLPYLLDNKQKILAQLNQEMDIIKDLNHELDSIVESSYDGICVTDAAGIILKTNRAFEHLYDVYDIVGVSTAELENKRILYPSGSILVIKEKRPVTFMQNIHNGRRLYVTATPIFGTDGEILKVLVNARDFEELEKLKKQITYSFLDKEKIINNYVDDGIIAVSSAMASVLEVCRRIAKVDTTVLLTGESGVGKEVLASYIHLLSDRKDGPIIKVNCGAIPDTLIESELFGYEAGAFTGANKEGKPGLFELADEGTLFLDEIGEMPYLLQVKLLQVLQEKALVRIGGGKPIKVDTRIISATNRNLEEMVAKGAFREDLYYRLNVVPIIVPPLRYRKDDIIPLANYSLEKFNKRYNLSKSFGREVLRIILSYNWPGNIRELMNLIERLVVTSEQDIIELDILPKYLMESSKPYSKLSNKEELPNLSQALENLERDILDKAYKCNNNSYKIADMLGINQSTVVRKLKKYGIT